MMDMSSFSIGFSYWEVVFDITDFSVNSPTKSTAKDLSLRFSCHFALPLYFLFQIESECPKVDRDAYVWALLFDR